MCSFNNDICIQIDGVAMVHHWDVQLDISVLNSFHDNIKFTYEQEKNNRLPFLDVLFIREDEKIHVTVFRKDTYNDFYLHWNSFSPISWKRRTLKPLISRAYMICSN